MQAIYGIFSGAVLIGGGVGILCGLFFNHVFGTDFPMLIMAATGSVSASIPLFLLCLR